MNSEASPLQILTHFGTSEQSTLLLCGDKTQRHSLLKEYETSTHLLHKIIVIQGEPEMSSQLLISELSRRWQIDIMLPNFTHEEQHRLAVDKLQQLAEPIILAVRDADQLPPLTLAALFLLAGNQEPGAVRLHIILDGDNLSQNLDNLRLQHLCKQEPVVLELTETASNEFEADDVEEPDSQLDEEAIYEEDFEEDGLVEAETNDEDDADDDHDYGDDEYDDDSDELDDELDDEDDDYEQAPSFWQRHKIKIIAVIVLILLLLGLDHYQNNVSSYESMQQATEQTANNFNMHSANTALPAPKPVANTPVKKPPVSKAKPVVAQPQKIVTPAKKVVKPAPKVVNAAVPAKSVVGKLAARQHRILLQNQAMSKPVVHTHPKAASVAVQQATYTLQILGTHSLSNLNHFIKKHGLKRTHIHRKIYHGKDWYVLSVGRYRSEAQAKAALKKLPKSVQHMHPWVKTF